MGTGSLKFLLESAKSQVVWGVVVCGRVDAEIEVKGTRPSMVSSHPGPCHCTRDRPTRPLFAPATPGLGIFLSPPGSLISVLLESGVPFSLCFKIQILLLFKYGEADRSGDDAMEKRVCSCYGMNIWVLPLPHSCIGNLMPDVMAFGDGASGIQGPPEWDQCP